jgi:ribosome modulation factor
MSRVGDKLIEANDEGYQARLDGKVREFPVVEASDADLREWEASLRNERFAGWDEANRMIREGLLIKKNGKYVPAKKVA